MLTMKILLFHTPIQYGWREEDNKYYFQWCEGDQLPFIQTITDCIDQEENIIENLNETETQENEDDSEYGEGALDDSSTDTYFILRLVIMKMMMTKNSETDLSDTDYQEESETDDSGSNDSDVPASASTSKLHPNRSSIST
ncbi:hypothetical protein QE152_g18153 [Popillia japonica]|uniref:Uncharacterized protein n=1 Tax=Popillia japonica TaxID=7064 RepID=A0AAW1L4C8_POPJA